MALFAHSIELASLSAENGQLRLMSNQLEERLRVSEERTRQSQENLRRLLENLEESRKQNDARTAILQDDERILLETTRLKKTELHSLSEELKRREEELEKHKAELRACRAKATELETRDSHSRLFIQTIETERRAFRETLATLLGDEEGMASEEDIKRRLRLLMTEVAEARKRLGEDTDRTRHLEEKCAEQARLHRLALVRARTAEEELTVVSQRAEAAETELEAVDIVKASLEKDVTQQKVFMEKLARVLHLDDAGAQVESTLVLAKAEHLVETEAQYTQLVSGESKVSFLHTSATAKDDVVARSLREAKRDLDLKRAELGDMRKRLQSGDWDKDKERLLKSTTRLDQLNRELLTKLSQQAAKGNDVQVKALRRQVEEQQKTIRDLEVRLRAAESAKATTRGDNPFKEISSHVTQLKAKSELLHHRDSQLLQVLHLSDDVPNAEIVKKVKTLEETSRSLKLPRSQSNEGKKMNEEGGYLGAVTYQVLYSGVLDKLRQRYADDERAPTAIHKLRHALKASEQASPSFLFDLTKILLAESNLNVNLQESFLRLQARAPTDDLEFPDAQHIAEFQELSQRAIALRRVLSRVPEEMADRRTFLETIKEIASSIKKLLDATNAILQVMPTSAQQAVEKRKREFVHYSKRFSNTLKEYFRDQNANQVSVSANQLIFQTSLIVKTVAQAQARPSR